MKRNRHGRDMNDEELEQNRLLTLLKYYAGKFQGFKHNNSYFLRNFAEIMHKCAKILKNVRENRAIFAICRGVSQYYGGLGDSQFILRLSNLMK